jgi:hypothetical protein
MCKPGHEVSADVRASISASLTGIKRSDETRQKMSIARRVENLSEATRAKYSAANRTRGPISDETRKRLSDSHKGIIPSEETRQKRSKAMKGIKRKPHTAETREKIRLVLTGKKLSEETKEKCRVASKGNKYAVGYRHTEEEKKKISAASKRFSGPLSSNWQGGVTPENNRIRHTIEMRLWRESVFSRDNFTCQKCGKRGSKLHSHHILSFAEHPTVRSAIDNGITLCQDCHKKFHRLYGTKSNDSAQLIIFISGVVEAEREVMPCVF